MDDWIEIERDDAHIKRERAKARELRKTSYFQNLFAQGICHYCKQKFPKAAVWSWTSEIVRDPLASFLPKAHMPPEIGG